MFTRQDKIRMVWSAACNAAIVLCGSLGAYLHFLKYGVRMFQYYTVCSNLFALLTSVICLYFNVKCLMGLRFFIPSWAKVLKYLSTCTLMVTLFIVIFVLVPLYGGGTETLIYFLFTGEMLYHHLLCPLFALASFVWIDEGSFAGERRLPLLAVAPTLLYGVIVTVLNVVGVVYGPYPFLRVTTQPLWQSALWYPAILLLAYVLAFLVWKLRNRFGYASDRAPENAAPESEGYTADGFIKNQDCFSAYTYRTIPASSNGCGAVAVYDLRRHAGQVVEIGDVFCELEKLHFLNIPGPTYLHAMRKYLKKYLPDFTEVTGREVSLAAAQESEMGLFRYNEQRVAHFVPYVRTADGAVRFFNVCDGQEDAVMPMERFVREHCVEGKVRLLYWKTI